MSFFPPLASIFAVALQAWKEATDLPSFCCPRVFTGDRYLNGFISYYGTLSLICILLSYSKNWQRLVQCNFLQPTAPVPVFLLVLCLNVQWICFLFLFQPVTCETPSRDNIFSEQSGQWCQPTRQGMLAAWLLGDEHLSGFPRSSSDAAHQGVHFHWTSETPLWEPARYLLLLCL